MDESKVDQRRVQRHSVATQRTCSLGVITFKQLEWNDVTAQVVDLSVSGVGIESDNHIEPGFVWFKDRVGGHKSGVLIWSRQDGARYRAGIKFVPLTRDEEQYVQEQVMQSRPHTPLRDPEKIIATIVDSIKKERGAGR